MKKLLLLMIISITALSQAMVWRMDDFEDGTFSDLSNYDQDGDGNFWEVVPSAKAGQYHISSQSAGGLTPDNLLDWPIVFVETDSYISFWVGAESETAFAETYEVYIDFSAQCQPSTSQLIWSETLTSADWKYVEIDIKPYILEQDPYAWDDEIYLGIRHYGSTDQSALLIDDVMQMSKPIVYEDEEPTEFVEGVVEPYKDIFTRWSIYDRTAFDADWNLTNNYEAVRMHYIITDGSGTQPEDSVQMSVSTNIDYYWCYDHTFTGMPMGTFIEYWVEIIDGSGYSIKGESSHHFAEWGEVNFQEGFEYTGAEPTPPDYWMPVGWVAYQTGSPLNTHDVPWWVDVAAQNVHSGLYSCTSESQNNWGETQTVDYIVTPYFRVNGTPTLKYYMNADTATGEEFTERWTVLISTVDGIGTDIENFTELKTDSIVPTGDNSDTWYEKTISLADFQDENVRIMWKHASTLVATKLDRHLNLDDVSVAEFPVINIADNGNAAVPGDDFIVEASASDYSGIDNLTLYYTVDGSAEVSAVMTDNGDGTYAATIPGQPLETRCSWYIVATDASAYSNTTTSETNHVIWFESGIIQWGDDVYGDQPDGSGAPWTAAIDFDFGSKAYLYLNKIEVGWKDDAVDMPWKLVEFDETPTDRVIGDLQGIHTFEAGGDTLLLDGNNTPIYGHVALCFESDGGDYIMLDEDGNTGEGSHPHAWQWNSVSGWSTNQWGNFYIKMYVSQTVGIEDEFVSSTTELVQNYPNPFNPETTISFYNRMPGDVKLTVYNTLGEKVATLFEEKMDSGFRKVNFNGSKLNSGVYYYTLNTPEKTLTKKMVLIK